MPSKVHASRLKYYIHDGVECFRLQLLGELAEGDVPDLTGCWNTARTTLANRKLLLDLTKLSKADEAGRQWMLSMVREGATVQPESYFRDHLANEIQDETRTPSGKLCRVANLFRSGRDQLGVESSTRAR